MGLGYVKLHRELLASPIWNKPPIYTRVFLYLLLKATHKGNANKRDMLPGSCTVTEPEIAEGCEYLENNKVVQPSLKVVRTILHWLEDNGTIHREAWAHNYTTVTLCNWEAYQEEDEGAWVDVCPTQSTTPVLLLKNVVQRQVVPTPSPSEPHASNTSNTSGGVLGGGNGRPKRQRVKLAAPDDEAQHRAVALAAEFYAGMDLEPTKLDISAVRALIVTEHLTDEQLRGLIKTNRQDDNLVYWKSPSSWLKTVGGGSKPVWRHLLEIRAAELLRYGNDERLPF